MVLENCDGELITLPTGFSANQAFRLRSRNFAEGSFVAPSVRRVLEYEPNNLMEKNTSDVCHPSYIGSLLRKLNEAIRAPRDGHLSRTIILMYEAPHKDTGYVWLELARINRRLLAKHGKG